MTKEEIIHLAALARIELSTAEIEKFTKELSAILSYVGTVQSLAEGSLDTAPRLGDRHNVLRTDAVTNEPEEYTGDILAEMPETEGRFMVVKKILQTE